MEILNNEYLQLVVWLFTMTYGLAFGVRNWTTRTLSLFTRGKYYQSDIGHILDSIWIVCVGFLIWTL